VSQSEIIIFESILTTFEFSFICLGSWGSNEYQLALKIKPSQANIAFSNPCSVVKLGAV